MWLIATVLDSQSLEPGHFPHPLGPSLNPESVWSTASLFLPLSCLDLSHQALPSFFNSLECSGLST